MKASVNETQIHNSAADTFFVLASVQAQTRKASPINWSDSTRDVYIDNELDRDAQVLTASSPSRLALISKRLESALVLNVTEQTVSTIPKDAFQFEPDRTAATSDAPMQVVGKFTRVDGPVYFFVASGKPILIRAHPGVTGEMSLNKLWETVPVWRSVMMNYQPNAEAVSEIKGNDKETKVTLAFGTWCPDSKNYVPRLLKAIDDAASDKIQLKLIGIDNQFREPVASVQPLAITNVPTVIVERGGREIGRIVETPAQRNYRRRSRRDPQRKAIDPQWTLGTRASDRKRRLFLSRPERQRSRLGVVGAVHHCGSRIPDSQQDNHRRFLDRSSTSSGRKPPSRFRRSDKDPRRRSRTHQIQY